MDDNQKSGPLGMHEEMLGFYSSCHCILASQLSLMCACDYCKGSSMAVVLGSDVSFQQSLNGLLYILSWPLTTLPCPTSKRPSKHQVHVPDRGQSRLSAGAGIQSNGRLPDLDTLLQLACANSSNVASE